MHNIKGRLLGELLNSVMKDKKLMEKLNGREKKILQLRYPLVERGLSYKEVGKIIGKSREMANIIERNALTKLYRRLALKRYTREGKLPEMPIEFCDSIGVGPRTCGILSHLGIKTIGELAGRSDEELRGIRSVGKGKIRTIREWLKEHDLKLKKYERSFLDTPIKELEARYLGPAKISFLQKRGINTLYDFLTMSDEELLRLRYIGDKVLENIREAITRKTKEFAEK